MNKDLVGASLSTLCICHCLLTPVILVFFGTGVITTIFSNELIHWLLIAPVALMVFLAFPQARKIHRQSRPGFLALAGLGLLITALTTHGWTESLLTVLGGTFLVCAHLLNHRLLNKHHAGCF